MTLIELVIVLSIFSILTGVVLFNYGDFSSSLTIQNLADDIALTIRRAQSYAIGVRGSSGRFTMGFGVNFSIRNPDDQGGSSFEPYSSSQKAFIFYSIPGSAGGQIYFSPKGESSCGVSSEENSEVFCLEKLSIKTADYIKGAKIKIANSNPKHLGENEQINIFFRRPFPEPMFCLIGKEDQKCKEDDNITEVIIEIHNSRNADMNKYVKIFNTGQISVSNNEK